MFCTEVDTKEMERVSGQRKGRGDVGILVPAALVLQAPLTSAQRARERSPLPISTDGLRGASCSRKKYMTTVRLLLSFLLHISHRPWPSLSHSDKWNHPRAGFHQKQLRENEGDYVCLKKLLQNFQRRFVSLVHLFSLWSSRCTCPFPDQPWSYWVHCTPATA